MYLVVIWLFFAAVPAMIKRFMLAISRIGGRNRYDEELFGRGPRGRMANYLWEYIEKNAARQQKQVEQFKKLETKRIPDQIDYDDIKSLRIEAVQKLKQYRPISIGQASRISGVSPADISVLLVYMEQWGKYNE